MNIIVVNTQPVPSSGSGAASVNRILSYAKGLIMNGDVVKILSTSTYVDDCWHEYDNVPVRHLGGTPKENVFGLIGFIKTSFRLIHALSGEKKDVVLFVTSNYFLIILLELYCKFSGTKIVNEKSEYPFVVMSNSRIRRFLSPLYTNTAYKMLDGMVLMTRPLMDYYKTKVGKNCQLLEMPMTVDAERFDIAKVETEYGNYIAYCGNMAGNKDGVINLISSFNIASSSIGNVKLLLIGGSSSQHDWEMIEEAVRDTHNNNIILFGKAERGQIPVLLKNAKALALARPSSLQSTGGFPTKLGEYLATGNPVVVTKVGDIPLYLNEKNAYMVEPDNIVLFAKAIEAIFSDYKTAIEIGSRGRELAKTVFSSKEQSRRLHDFLLSING